MKNLILATLCSLSLLGCKKPKPDKQNEKPPQTQIGANILWCKVNGEPHTYTGKPGAINANGVTYVTPHFPDSTVYIEILAGDIKYNDGLYIGTNLKKLPPEISKIYSITNHPPYSYSSYNIYQGVNNNKYEVDTNSSIIVFTRFDDAVAAGTFEFHGKNKNSEEIHITEGFFDIAK